jgi:hypothetical protein
MKGAGEMPGLLATQCRVHIHGLFRLSSIHIVLGPPDVLVESITDQEFVWISHCVLVVRRFNEFFEWWASELE